MRVSNVAFACLISLLSVAAKADTVTSSPVSGSGSSLSGSGTLYATSNGNGSYTITGIDVPGITSLVAYHGFDDNDNLLFPNANPLLDGSGFAFTDQQSDGAYEVDLFYSSSSPNPGYEANVEDTDRDSLTVPVTFSLSAPATPAYSPVLHAAIFAAATTPTAFHFSYAVAVPGAAAAVTPEPSSFALLGTGLLGLACTLKRRLA